MSGFGWDSTHNTHSDHVCDFKHEVKLDKKDMPRFVKSSVTDKYCSICGAKQTLRERLAELQKATI